MSNDLVDFVIDATIEAGTAAGMEAFKVAFRKAARAELERQLAGLRGRVGVAPTPTAPAPAKAADKGKRGRRIPKPVPAPQGVGAKRTRKELERTTAAVLQVIRENPGILPEQIAKKLGLKSSDVALPLAMLREPGDGPLQVRWSGVKRHTKYTAV